VDDENNEVRICGLNIFINMNQELSKILVVLGKFVKLSNDCTKIEIEFDESGNYYYPKDSVFTLNGGDHRGYLNTPIPISRPLEKFMDELLDNEVSKYSPLDEEYSLYSMVIDFESQKITINGIYYVTEVSESFDRIIELEGEEKQLFWNKLSSEIGDNQSTFNVDIIGGGDSGYLECASHRLSDDVEEILYGILEEFVPGWEINEGSGGSFVINPTEKRIQFILDVYEQQQKSEEEYMIFF